MIAIHPGEYITEVYLEPYEITGSELAERLDVSPSTVSRILTKKSEVTPEMAIKLEKVLGRSAQSWLTMQMDYSLSNAYKSVKTENLHPLSF